MLKVQINGIEAVEEPTGVKELSERLYYSVELGGYLSEVSGTVSFFGEDYDRLKELRDTDICGAVGLVIEDTDVLVPVFNGKMFLTDMEWFPDEHRVDAEVLDDGYLSKIDGAREIEAQVNVGISKNGVAITSLALSGLTFWNELRTLNYPNHSGMRVGDALEFLVDFMTDGEVGFVSDFFDTNTEPQYYDMIVNGKEVRNGGGVYPRISFDSLFRDLQRIYNLAFALERTEAGIRMRIEPKSYFYKEVSSIEFPDAHNPKQTIKSGSFYANVSFGSSKTSDIFTYYPNIPFSGTYQENYHLGGECNINTKLGLQLTTLVTDPNVIQDVLPSGTSNDNYDDDTFLVRFADLNNSHDAMTASPAGGGFYYYNEPYSNYRVSQRWFDQVPESIFSFLGGGNDASFATQSVSPYLYDNITANADFLLCDDDTNPPNHDAGGNYQTGALSVFVPIDVYDFNSSSITLTGNGGYYTAPANGMYNVTARFYIESGIWFQPAGLLRVNSSNVALEWPWDDLNPDGTIFYGPAIGGFWVEHNHTFFMETGDYVTFGFGNSTGISVSDATFKVLDPLGGEWQTNNARDVRLIETAFNYDIPQDDWNDIKDDPFKTFRASYNSGSVNGWISEMSRNRLTGEGSVRLQSKP